MTKINAGEPGAFDLITNDQTAHVFFCGYADILFNLTGPHVFTVSVEC